MKTRWMGPEVSCAPGTIMDIDDYTGKQLIELGYAELISTTRTETAMITSSENAMMPKPAARKPVRKR
jgi:hypothetical protein